VSSLDLRVDAVNEAGASALSGDEGAEAVGMPSPEVLEAVDGTLEVGVPPRTDVVVRIGAAAGAPVPVTFSVNRPVAVVRDDDDGRRLTPNEPLEGIVDPLEDADTFELDLDEGDRVRVRVESPAGGDPVLFVQAPGIEPADAEVYDDGDTGLFGLGVDEDLVAEASGTYVLAVSAADEFATYYRITIDRN
jgi:hypothetical protein